MNTWRDILYFCAGWLYIINDTKNHQNQKFYTFLIKIPFNLFKEFNKLKDLKNKTSLIDKNKMEDLSHMIIKTYLGSYHWKEYYIVTRAGK